MKNYNQNDTLRHLQSVLLQIIVKIDELCLKHNITYYLNGGNALGAIRHNGFIPWDDDFDIMMKSEDYKKFLTICRRELDPKVWYIQEAWVDWPGCFSKIRLKNTYLKDIGEWEGIQYENRGIYIDVFEIINAPSSKILKLSQYVGAKILNSYSLLQKGYITDSFLKKTAIIFSKILNNKFIFQLVKSSVFRYNKKDSKELAHFFGMSRFHNAFYDKEVFDIPYYHQYEDIKLPLPTKYDTYLKQSFGNYMQLPPIDKQKPAHSIEIDFGSY
ncbi:MAG: LicD family protein [Muribaculaceae bacterium]|nr:LicD family protein [Muribaculaceae bacterium]